MINRQPTLLDDCIKMSDRFFNQTFTYGIRSKPEDNKGSKTSQDTIASSPTFSSTISGSLLSQQPERQSRSPSRRFSAIVSQQLDASDINLPVQVESRKGSKDLAEISAESGRILARLNVNESHLKEKIQALEDTVAEYERQKFNVMGTFADYRERVVERERKLEAEYSAKIITLSEDVLMAKRDFEDRMKQFQALQEKFEREKEQALEKLREEHQKEIQSLEGRCSEAHLLNLEQKYILEIQRLDEERKSLKVEKEKLGEIFESKLRRAQSLYETELTAAKCLYRTELEAFQDHEEALKEELIGRQEEFRDRLDDLQQQFNSSKEELTKWKREVIELEDRLKLKEIEVQMITKQLREAKKETDDALAKVRNAETELQITKQKCLEHEEQLIRKSDMLSVVESARNKLEIVIQELQTELKSLKGKVTFLENERQNLESQSQTQAQLNDKQLQTFEKVLDNVNKQNENVKEEYEQKLENERQTFEEREFNIKQEYATKLNDLERQSKDFQSKFDTKLSEERWKIAKELKQVAEKEIEDLRVENATLKEELASIKSHEINDFNEDGSPTSLTLTCDFHERHKDEIAALKEELEERLRPTIRKEIIDENNATNSPGQSDKSDQVVELQGIIDALNSTIKSLHAKIEELETVIIKELKLKFESTSKENEMLSSQLESAKHELEEYKAAQKTKIGELTQQLDLQHRKYREDVEQEKRSGKENNARREIEKLLMDTKDEMEEKQKQLKKMKDQVEMLKDELLNANRELIQKTQEIDEIKTGTKGYIKTRENQQHKKHQTEIESLKKEHEIEIQKFVEAQQSLQAEKELLLKKISAQESNISTSESKTGSENLEKLKNDLDALKEQLRQKDVEIKKLQNEKLTVMHKPAGHLKTESTEIARERCVVPPSSIGSIDSLKKRDSICSVGSVKEAQLCRKANMAIVNKWQCLVEQVKNSSGNRRRDSRSSLYSLPPLNVAKFSGGPSTSGTTSGPVARHSCHTSSHKHLDSQDSTASGSGSIAAEPSTSSSQHKLHTDESEERNTRSPAPNGLRPLESRRSSAKSPSRSPAPGSKSSSSVKRPAWRL